MKFKNLKNKIAHILGHRLNRKNVKINFPKMMGRMVDTNQYCTLRGVEGEMNIQLRTNCRRKGIVGQKV